MLPLSLLSPSGISRQLAERAKALRLHRGWTREELAHRADISLSSLKRFETRGEISLHRLLCVAQALDALDDIGNLFKLPPAQGLDELEQRAVPRQRGRRKRRS